MQIETVSQPFQIVRPSGDSTDAGFPTRAPQAATPSGNGVIATGGGGAYAQNAAVLVPYGTTTAAQTFIMRVLGWRSVGSDTKKMWLPITIGEFTCTLDTMSGIAGGAVDNNHLICSQIALDAGTATINFSCETVSPANGEAAHAILSLKGFQLIEFLFNINASAVSANCLLALI